MSVSFPYINPPIKEAIITFNLNRDISLSVMNSFVADKFIQSSYPLQKSIFHYNVKVNDAESASSVNASIQGYSLECGEDCFKLIKITSSQITFHNFKKYIGWPEMIGEFTNFWEIISKLDGTLEIQEINVRYVNQINIPLPLNKGLEEYLTILPSLPTNSKPLDNFFIQLQNTSEDNSMHSILNQTIIHKNTNSVTVLLDIAVGKKNIDNLQTAFENMHNFKNELFESALTQKTKQLFN